MISIFSITDKLLDSVVRVLEADVSLHYRVYYNQRLYHFPWTESSRFCPLFLMGVTAPPSRV